MGSLAMAKDIINDSSGIMDTSRHSVNSFLKTSPAAFSRKIRRSHRYLPQGVLKVVRKLLSLSRGKCQYPDFASSKLKYFESASSGRMSSTVLLYHSFLFIAWWRSFGSRHSRKEPSGFLTGTIELIHSVCSLTSLMTPSCVNQRTHTHHVHISVFLR